nr:hypothetical protein [Kyrpidia tusciae]
MIYTDVWASMGQEAEREERLRPSARHQVNEALRAPPRRPTSWVHALPARPPGEESPPR